jgi:uncharacterized protein YecT (DUF1311 family)
MPGKQNADPIPGTTYAGFAAAAPSEATPPDPELRLSRETRTYTRDELRRRSARRRRAPLAVVVGLAVFAVAGAVGFALLYEPKTEFTASPALAAQPPAPDLADAAAPAEQPPALEAAAPQAAAPAIDVPPAAAPVAAARPPAASAVPRPAAAPKTPADGRPRSTSQAAADRAATDRVSASAALDQEVNKAYAEALRAGAPAGPLGEAQENWIIRRDRLRREDPEMAEDLARARIAELQALATKKAEASPADPQAAP